jgi:copper(I)-binding protein
VSRSLRRGAVAALALAIAPVLAACAASSNAATLEVKPNVAATSVGSLKLNGVALVVGTDGSANVTANIANWADQADTLTSVSVAGQNATLTGPTQIPAGGALQLGAGTTANIPGFSGQEGANAPVTFQFQNGGSVTVQALVNSAQGVYSSYAPTATPTPAAPVGGAPSASAPASKPAGGAKTTTSPSASPSKH